MKYSSTLSVKRSVSLTLIMMTLVSGSALAQTGRADLGKQEFLENCAVCHGNDGKGKGPYLEFLQRSPTDLTTLTKRNGGVFPVSRMYETIEGLNVPSHGSRDMPIWGNSYRIKAAEYYVDIDYNPEAFVRSRILALIEYISKLQER